MDTAGAENAYNCQPTFTKNNAVRKLIPLTKPSKQGLATGR